MIVMMELLRKAIYLYPRALFSLYASMGGGYDDGEAKGRVAFSFYIAHLANVVFLVGWVRYDAFVLLSPAADNRGLVLFTILATTTAFFPLVFSLIEKQRRRSVLEDEDGLLARVGRYNWMVVSYLLGSLLLPVIFFTVRALQK